MNTTIEKQPVGSVKPSHLCDWLVCHGVATVTSEECAHLLGVPRREVPQRLVRLRATGSLVALARGLWAAVPAEYRSMGAPEPMGYIDDLMSFNGRRYCVGWLAAASLRGASHQAPQAFQVAVDGAMAGRTVGRNVLDFHVRSYVGELPASRLSTSAGTANVATAGALMLMACADPMLCGGLDNVATVVAELADCDDGYMADVTASSSLFPTAAARRLGWLLEHVACACGLEALENLCRCPGDPSTLSPHGGRCGAIDLKWNVIVNADVEADL